MAIAGGKAVSQPSFGEKFRRGRHVEQMRYMLC